MPLLDGSLGLDIFAHRAITIIPRKAIVLESPSSLADRVKTARAFPIRIVRDVEGIALSVDGAVRTPEGLLGWNWTPATADLWSSPITSRRFLDCRSIGRRQAGHFKLANGITVAATIRTRDLVMDGNIGAQFLNQWALTLDLEHERAWLAPLSSDE